MGAMQALRGGALRFDFVGPVDPVNILGAKRAAPIVVSQVNFLEATRVAPTVASPVDILEVKGAAPIASKSLPWLPVQS
jgi:hypothetical protein